MNHLKKIAVPALIAAGVGLFSTPANAFSLRDTAHGETLFQNFSALINADRLRLGSVIK